MCDIPVDCIDNDRMRKIKGLEERLKTLQNFLRGSHEILQSQMDRAKVNTLDISNCLDILHYIRTTRRLVGKYLSTVINRICHELWLHLVHVYVAEWS